MFDDGQWQTPARLDAKRSDLVVVDVDGVGVPDIVAHPIERLHVGDRAQTMCAQGEAFLVERLAEMGMQPDPMSRASLPPILASIRPSPRTASREPARFAHSAGVRDRGSADDPLAIGHDRVFRPRRIVRRQAPFDSPRDMLPREATKRTPTSAAANLIVDATAVLKDVGVVEDRRAAGSAPAPRNRRSSPCASPPECGCPRCDSAPAARGRDSCSVRRGDSSSAPDRDGGGR